jgi:hypothetical protein
MAKSGVSGTAVVRELAVLGGEMEANASYSAGIGSVGTL